MYRTMIAVILMCWLSGCGSDVGGKYSTVTIKTDSNDASTYLVPFDTWNAMVREGKPRNASTLAGFLKARGKEEVLVSGVPATLHVVVIERSGKIESKEFKAEYPKSEVVVSAPR